MFRAEMSAPGRAVEDEEYCASGVVKFCERCCRIGVIRSSSSRRGRAREVAYLLVSIAVLHTVFAANVVERTNLKCLI